MHRIGYFLLWFLLPNALLSQEIRHPITIAWQESIFREGDGLKWEIPRFIGGIYDDSHPGLPILLVRIPVNGPAGEGVLTEVVTEPMPWTYPGKVGRLSVDEVKTETLVIPTAEGFEACISMIPLVLKNGTYHRILRATMVFRPFVLVSTPTFRKSEFKQESVLKAGEIYQLSIPRRGVYQIRTEFLRNQLRIDPGAINPREVKLYAGHAGPLPLTVQMERTDDLEEIPIQVFGEEDGRWDTGDYLVFYADGPDAWVEDSRRQLFTYENNPYSLVQYIYLIISPQPGKRIATRRRGAEPSAYSGESDQYAVFEEEKVNLLEAWELAEGSGNEWYGDLFRNTREYRYNNAFQFPGFIPGFASKIRASMVLRALEPSTFTITLNNQTLRSGTAQPVSRLEGDFANIEEYAHPAELFGTINLSEERLSPTVSYPPPGGTAGVSQGWLDFIEVNTRCTNRYAGTPLFLSDWQAVSEKIWGFRIENGAGIQVWDITRPFGIAAEEVTSTTNESRFAFAPEGILRRFVAFKAADNLPAPAFTTRILNQNLHAIGSTDMLIVYPRAFERAARRLAEHRSTHDKFKVTLAAVESIFHEFSSGKPDPAAIRNFARMVYQRGSGLRYLLLLGDGSYDHRNLNKQGNNPIPTFQRESLNPLYAFPSDDFYGILDGDNQTDILTGKLVLGVGRIPVNSPLEAEAIIEKIVRYDRDPEAFDSWRNRLVFVADDEDGNLHLSDADEIAEKLQARQPELNLEKIYLDAYPQVATSGGNRFPEVTESINQAVFRGALAITYLGHGSPKGWAQERVLTIPDIVNWRNRQKMPLLITATCSFSAYDDPGFTSAGEEAFLNPGGGAIALLTTVRAVFANQNAELTDQTLQALFRRRNGETPAMGDAMREAKNSLTGSFITINSRKYALIGDPSQRPGIPRYRVETTALNGKPTSQGIPSDTLGAMNKVQIEGEIQDATGKRIDSFNGQVKPAVFDKIQEVRTLGQDNGSIPTAYDARKNSLFNGNVSVKNGKFTFSFIVPKDIDYRSGTGKISYYAVRDNRREDAGGYFNQIRIGGTGGTPVSDNRGPEISLFLNNTGFRDGALTHPDPMLIVQLKDDFGINVVGNSIGHDLEAILDEDSKNTYVLNDFYTALADRPNEGEVRFPFRNLSEGKHSLRVKAWDVANNASEATLQFVVSRTMDIRLDRVLNYPNPFTTRTCFQFTHSLGNMPLEARVEIYTITGQRVRTLEAEWSATEQLTPADCIAWDGRDDFGDPLARGIYLYKIFVATADRTENQITGESRMEKLVILK